MLGQNHFDEPNWHALTFLHPKFAVQCTSGVALRNPWWVEQALIIQVLVYEYRLRLERHHYHICTLESVHIWKLATGTCSGSLQCGLTFALTFAHLGIAVVQFNTRWSEGCRQMASVVEQLYKLNPTVNFFKVIIYTSSVLFSKEPNTQSFTQKMNVHE
jgi:hypothetical protein